MERSNEFCPLLLSLSTAGCGRVAFETSFSLLTGTRARDPDNRPAAADFFRLPVRQTGSGRTRVVHNRKDFPARRGDRHPGKAA